MATDYMVFNVTKDDITVRMSAIDEEIWLSPPLKEKVAPDFTKSIPMSDFTLSGVLAWPEIVQPIYDEVNEIYGTDFEPGLKQQRTETRGRPGTHQPGRPILRGNRAEESP